MNKKKSEKLIFIAGLGHSGSTLFDLLLGAQVETIGLGEIDVFVNKNKRDWFLERYDKYPCTCGKSPSECSVWGSFKEHLENGGDQPYEFLYNKLFEIVIKETGATTVVDSSKNLRSLKQVYHSIAEMGLSPQQFYVIHLVKDVRSFTTSALRTGRSTSILKTFKDWVKVNKRIDQFLKTNNIKTLRIGYDELTLSTKFIMERVSDFIYDGENKEVSLDLKKTRSHIISGNNMRLDQADSIRYDYRWFNDSKINFLYVFVPGLRELNKRYVYSNVDYFLKGKTRFRPPKVS